MDSFKQSLEELFSGFAPPEPDVPSAAPEEKVSATSAPRSRRREKVVPPARETAQPVRSEIPLIGVHTRNIRTQLLGNVLLVLVAILWTAFLIGSGILRVNRAVATVGEETSRANAALVAGKAAAELFVAIGNSALAQDSDAFIRGVTQGRERLKEAQERLYETVATVPLEDPLWSDLMLLRSAISQVDLWTTYLIQQAELGQWESIQASQLYLIPYYLNEVNEATKRIERSTQTRLAMATQEAAAARDLARNIAVAWGAVLVVVIVGVNFSVLRSIAEPLEQMAEAAAQLASGHLETRVVTERVDEFGRLAQSFNQMADRLQTLYNELEERVRERTRALQEANYALQRRAIQLEASAEVSRSIISIFNVDELLRRAVDLIRDRFGFYHAGIFLIDETGEWAVLREATGEAGAQMKAQGHRLRVAETSMVGWTALHRQPRIALDVGKDAVRFANPLLPYTRSEMTLPLMVGGRLLGVLNVQSTEEAAFDEDDIRALQSMADQLAIAIENARRLSEEAAILEATSPIYRFSRRLSTATTVVDVANVIIEAVSETEADGCVVVEFESSDGVPEMLTYRGVWRRDREPTFRTGMRVAVTEVPFSASMLSQMWVSENIQQDDRASDRARDLFRATGVGALVNIPLRVGDRPVGQVVILRSAPGPFSPASLRLYEVIGDQAAVALERARLLESMRQRAEQEEVLRSIADQITATFDLRTALQTTLQQLGRVLDARGGYAELGTK